MLLRQRVKTATHVVELLNFVQDRIRECMGTRCFHEPIKIKGAPFIEAPRTADNPCYAATAT